MTETVTVPLPTWVKDTRREAAKVAVTLADTVDAAIVAWTVQYERTTVHVVEPAVAAPMSTEIPLTVPEYGWAPVHVTTVLSSDVVAESGSTYDRTARPASDTSATEDAAAGAECTTTDSGTVEVSASVTQHNHCPVAAATDCPAVPDTVEVPRRQLNELLPAAMEMAPFPPVRPVVAAESGREWTMTGWPHAPVIDPRTPRERQVQKPGPPFIDASPGADPVADTVSPSDAHETSHAVESAPSSPTRTATVPAVASRHGVSTGAAGAATPPYVGGAVRSGLVIDARERDSMTAPSAKLGDDVQEYPLVIHRTAPVASRTVLIPPGSLSSQRRCVPPAIPAVPDGSAHATESLVREVIEAAAGARTVKTTEWNASSVGVPRLSGTRMRPTTCIESGPDHWMPSGDMP